MTKYESMDTYQEDAKTFDAHSSKIRRIMLAMGLAAEAGESAGKVYKLARDYNNFYEADELTLDQRYAIAKELGDVLWFTAMLADEFGFSLSDIAQINIGKLEDRMQRGVINGEGDNR